MSEENEVEEIEQVNSFPGELLSPINSIEISIISRLLETQFSSDLAVPFWDFFECINEYSVTNNDQLIITPNDLPLIRFPDQPPYDHNSLQETYGNYGKQTRILSPLDYIKVDYLSILKERMMGALSYFKDKLTDCVLAQIWLPVKNGCSYDLTPLGEPFVLDPGCNALQQYRMVSVKYKYHTENIRALFALPIFEVSGGSCLGVLEISTTSQKISYAQDIDNICKALKTVDLKSSDILDSPDLQFEDESHELSSGDILKKKPEEEGYPEIMEKRFPLRLERFLSNQSNMAERKIDNHQGKNLSSILSKTSERITLEDLEKVVGLPQNDAAEHLGVSRSTLKRLCRRYGIPRWPSRKRKRNHGEENIESVQGSSERVVAHTFLKDTSFKGNTIEDMGMVENSRALHLLRTKRTVHYQPPTQDTRKKIIKAQYKDDIIKFSLSNSSGIEELQKEVLKRLNLKKGAFTIKYLDIDQDWVLIAIDEDLQECMQASIATGTSAIQMSIQSM